LFPKIIYSSLSTNYKVLLKKINGNKYLYPIYWNITGKDFEKEKE